MVNEFYKSYSDNGFYFNKSILTRYCLSLYTKPFVILSGISGTGKTKIAQLFKIPQHAIRNDMVASAPLSIAAEEPVPYGEENPFILLTVTSGVANDDGRGNLAYNQMTRRAIWTDAELATIDERINALLAAGTGDNIIEPELITIVDNQNHQTIQAGVYLQRAESPLLRLRFKSKRRENPAYDYREYFRAHWNIGDVIRIERTGNKEFRIVRENNADDIEIAEQQIEEEAKLVENTCFVSVRSNWTDGSEIFGYYNSLEDRFIVGKVLKFILTATDYPTKPFFLILDEMNLSKVENYFSDFLSCLESRIEIEGEFKQEKITLHSGTELISTNDEIFEEITASIAIPRNLYVTGTINVDESTYMFSPKVLDRANVIEFNDVNLSEYGANEASEAGIELTTFPEFSVTEIASKRDFMDLGGTSKELFIEINDILKPYNLHFGYRVANEMALFIKNMKQYVNENPETIKWGEDVQIVQKILPKFNGSLGKLEDPLKKILQYLSPDLKEVDLNLEVLGAIDFDATSYPLSIKKIVTMLTHLLQNGYANFIE